MNKWTVICIFSVVLVALTETSLTSDKKRIVNALKNKFKQLKLNVKSGKADNENSELNDVPVASKIKDAHEQAKHEKAASAIGLALLDLHKPAQSTKISSKGDNENEEPDDDDDEMNDDDDFDDDKDDENTAEAPSKSKKTKSPLVKATKNLDEMKLDGKSRNTKNVKVKNDKNLKDKGHKSNGTDKSVSDDKHSESKDDVKKSDKKLKSSVQLLKNSVKHLKYKDLQSVDVGDLKKLLATSVENLDKAEKAINHLLQYDEKKQSGKKTDNASPAAQAYPQMYPGYQQQQQQQPYSGYQTCPGQCNNLCAPSGCTDQCCRSYPNSGMQQYNAPAVQARGSYQQGLVNAYPPMTALGAAQTSQPQTQQQGQAPGQQCGAQCSPQSCAPSCSQSCCSSTAPQSPPQSNSGCSPTCLNSCTMNCPSRCCVPGKK